MSLFSKYSFINSLLSHLRRVYNFPNNENIFKTLTPHIINRDINKNLIYLNHSLYLEYE